ncbi:MAG: hypothetical protein P4L03_04255 [Terracidiphilus sp.]|nr:hypothetical protein [Terracidiphilus sp.]
MEDLLLSILSALIEIALEFFMEFAGEMLISGLLRVAKRIVGNFSRVNAFVIAILFGILGTLLGFLSVALFPHPLVHPSRIHGISMIIAPLMTGLAMMAIGRAIRLRGKETTEIENFSNGFVFALAMAIVRFVCVG